MSLLPAQYVKRGMWVNLEDGPILGRVITTDLRTGNIVVVIVAVAATFGTTHLWNLIVFIYHQLRVKEQQEDDGLFHQQQALLRTLPTAGSLMSAWIKLWWSWRKRSEKAFVRSLPHLLLGLFYAIATIAISLSTSYIISTSNIQVLVDSPNCGPPILDYKNAEFNESDALYLISARGAGKSYADNCYRNFSGSAIPNACAAYIRPNIGFKQTRVECPFQSLCAKINLPGLLMDSGLMDLNDAYGLNLPKSERLKYRRKTVCSVLDLSGRTKVENRTLKTYPYKDQSIDLYLGESNEYSNLTWKFSTMRANATNVPRTEYVLAFAGSDTGMQLLTIEQKVLRQWLVRLLGHVHVYAHFRTKKSKCGCCSHRGSAE